MTQRVNCMGSSSCLFTVVYQKGNGARVGWLSRPRHLLFKAAT